MAATAQQQLDEANDSLLRHLQSDVKSWSESDRSQNRLEIRDLRELIKDLQTEVSAAGGRAFVVPVTRVNV